LPLRAVTGDIGVLMAAVEGLQTSARRRHALMRHIWRPRRFRALLDRFSGRTPMPPSRAALLAGQASSDAPLIGLRSRADIEERIAALHEDAATPPLSGREVQQIEALLEVREVMPHALSQLHDLAVDMPDIAPAVARVTAREAALRARGVDTDNLMFEASYGRSSMEYYDGFVFGFRAEARADLPTIASGGRYDAMTRRLGQGREIPAVGGVMRPGLMLVLEGAP
jgi:ATP phosphoribosyltransferase regulatory subunit